MQSNGGTISAGGVLDPFESCKYHYAKVVNAMVMVSARPTTSVINSCTTDGLSLEAGIRHGRRYLRLG